MLVISLKNEKQDYSEYLKRLTEMADNHNVDAAKRLGNLYYDDIVGESNYILAMKYYMIAANMGDLWSKYRVGEMYRDGKGADVDYQQSIHWFEQAALQGHVGAIHSIINLCLSNGDTINYDYKKCYEMLRQLSLSGSADAARRMGNIYYDGIGLEKDYCQAMNYYEIAYSLGDLWSCVRLGDMYRDGKGVERNIDSALQRYLYAANRNHLGAIHNIIMLYHSRLLSDLKTLNDVLSTLSTIAESGNADAYKRLANYYYDGMAVVCNYEKALYYYEKAALLGDSFSKSRLAEMYRDGKGVSANQTISSVYYLSL